MKQPKGYLISYSAWIDDTTSNVDHVRCGDTVEFYPEHFYKVSFVDRKNRLVMLVPDESPAHRLVIGFCDLRYLGDMGFASYFRSPLRLTRKGGAYAVR